jgi:hypothetical protein
MGRSDMIGIRSHGDYADVNQKRSKTFMMRRTMKKHD